MSFAVFSIFIVLANPATATGADDPAMLAADKDFVTAVTKGDVSLLGRILDDDFTWTDENGKTYRRASVLAGVPHAGIRDEQGAQVHRYTYGQAGVVQVNSGKLHLSGCG